MNIDVRNINGDVLKSMKKLIKTHNFSSTAKATRFVLVDYWDKKDTVKILETKLINIHKDYKAIIKDLDKKLNLRDRELEKVELLKLKLKEFVNSEKL